MRLVWEDESFYVKEACGPESGGTLCLIRHSAAGPESASRLSGYHLILVYSPALLPFGTILRSESPSAAPGLCEGLMHHTANA